MTALYVIIYFAFAALANEILRKKGINNFIFLLLAIPFWPIALLIMGGLFIRELYFFVINKDSE